jgi:hypothetical protein
VSDLLNPDFELIFVDEVTTISQVLKLFAEKDILSSPVKSKHNTFLGNVDMVIIYISKFLRIFSIFST